MLGSSPNLIEIQCFLWHIAKKGSDRLRTQRIWFRVFSFERLLDKEVIKWRIGG